MWINEKPTRGSFWGTWWVRLLLRDAEFSGSLKVRVVRLGCDAVTFASNTVFQTSSHEPICKCPEVKRFSRVCFSWLLSQVLQVQSRHVCLLLIILAYINVYVKYYLGRTTVPSGVSLTSKPNSSIFALNSSLFAKFLSFLAKSRSFMRF